MPGCLDSTLSCEERDHSSLEQGEPVNTFFTRSRSSGRCPECLPWSWLSMFGGLSTAKFARVSWLACVFVFWLACVLQAFGGLHFGWLSFSIVLGFCVCFVYPMSYHRRVPVVSKHKRLRAYVWDPVVSNKVDAHVLRVVCNVWVTCVCVSKHVRQQMLPSERSL